VCEAMGAPSDAAAIRRLQEIAVQYSSDPKLNLGPFVVGGANVSSPADSYTQDGQDFIDINSSFNIVNPTYSVGVTPAGDPTTANMLAPLAQLVGVPNLTPAQAVTLVTLHELEHLYGAPQETKANAAAYNSAIYNDCIKNAKLI
jgi:hypothetical protein